MSGEPALMLYDGLCGFCNGTVKWVLEHDHGDRFRFAPQQSNVAEDALRRHGLSREGMIASNSVYLVLNPNSAQEQLLCRSDVTVGVLRLLGGIWGWLGSLLGLLPRSLRDAGYTLMARNRYRIGGRLETCPIPSEADREKFVGL